MPVCFSILALLVLQLAPPSSPSPLTSRGIMILRCPTCKEGGGPPQGPPQGPPHQGDSIREPTTQQQSHPPAGSSESSSASVLAVGDSCGVYTLRCAPGLRCTPPDQDPRPLRALLEGRGVCSINATIRTTSPTQRVHTTDAAVPSKDLEKAPCAKMLILVLEGLDTQQVFQTHQDIYMPNCDKQGFFRKKQCRTSRGSRQRSGRCWCVEKNGMECREEFKLEHHHDKRGNL